MDFKRTQGIKAASSGAHHELNSTHAFDDRTAPSLHTVSSIASLSTLPLELRREIFFWILDEFYPCKPYAESKFLEFTTTAMLLGPLFYDTITVRNWLYKTYFDMRAQCAMRPVLPRWTLAKHTADSDTRDDIVRKQELLDSLFSDGKMPTFIECDMHTSQFYDRALFFLEIRYTYLKFHIARWDKLIDVIDTYGEQSQWWYVAHAVFAMGNFVAGCVKYKQMPGVRDLANSTPASGRESSLWVEAQRIEPVSDHGIPSRPST